MATATLSASTLIRGSSKALGITRFIETLRTAKGSKLALPFDHKLIPMLSNIGATPLVKIEDRIWAKLEGHNPSGSVKDRTVSSIFLNMLINERKIADAEESDAKPAPIVLVSSGSAAMALVRLRQALLGTVDLPDVVIAMPKKYGEWEIPQEIMAMEGTNTFNDASTLVKALNDETTETGCNVALLEGPFIDTLKEAKQVATKENYQICDQHFDESAMEGHRSTAEELLRDCPGLTDVVCGTGTGATAAGLRRFLPDSVTVHSRSAESGDISGLCDVSRYKNFCNVSKLAGYDKEPLDKDVAGQHVQMLSESHDIEAGSSSGAAYWLAKQVANDNPDAQIAFIAADGISSQVNPGHSEVEVEEGFIKVAQMLAASKREQELDNLLNIRGVWSSDQAEMSDEDSLRVYM